MRISTVALAAALAGFTIASAAEAQRVGQTKNTQTSIRAQSGSASKSEEEAKAEADKLTTGRQVELSKDARKAIVELQDAVNANDTANIPAKLAAAQAVATTPDDRYVIALFQTKAATNAGDLAAMRTGIDALRASGIIATPDLVSRYNDLGKRHYDAKQYDLAASAFEQTLGLQADNADALKMLAGTRAAQGRSADAVGLMAKSIAATKAAGGKPKENDYKFAARIAYDAKAPATIDITRSWLADYPTSENWRDALLIYRNHAALRGDAKLDVLRLARAANALEDETDYAAYVRDLVALGHLNEAKAVMDEGAAKNAINLSQPVFKQFAPRVAKAPTRAAIDAAAKTAASKGAAAAMEAGTVLYGIGAFAEAAPLFKAAIGKGGIDANLANLRLGMALARSGDKAGATAALNAVGGAHADTAKYWLIWLNSRG